MYCQAAARLKITPGAATQYAAINQPSRTEWLQLRSCAKRNQGKAHMLAKVPHFPHHVTFMRFAPSATVVTTHSDTRTSRMRMISANQSGTDPSMMMQMMATTIISRSTVGSYILPNVEVWLNRR